MTHEKLSLGLKAQEAHLQKLGFDTTFCLVDLGETAERWCEQHFRIATTTRY